MSEQNLLNETLSLLGDDNSKGKLDESLSKDVERVLAVIAKIAGDVDKARSEFVKHNKVLEKALSRADGDGEDWNTASNVLYGLHDNIEAFSQIVSNSEIISL